jgi:circadian clock protein KaiB
MSNPWIGYAVVMSLEPIYRLRLYVTGSSPRSARAIVNVRRLCEDNLRDRYDLEVIDIARQPAIARAEQLVAAPTLVKQAPLPVRRFIGDMSHTEAILRGLDLTPATC